VCELVYDGEWIGESDGIMLICSVCDSGGEGYIDRMCC